MMDIMDASCQFFFRVNLDTNSRKIWGGCAKHPNERFNLIFVRPDLELSGGPQGSMILSAPNRNDTQAKGQKGSRESK